MDKKVSKTDIENQLLEIAKEFLTELGSERAKLAISLNADLERDLGLGSLEKAEFLSRIEKTFDVTLPDAALIQTKTANDLIIIIQKASPSQKIHIEVKETKLEAAKIDLSTAATLVDVIRQYGEIEPKRPHIYFQEENGGETIIPYGELYEQAQQVAKGLIKRGIKPGDTIAIMLPTSAEFFYSFFGILLAGAVPVPIYPPLRPDQIEEYAKREALILRNAEVRILITFQQAEALSNLLQTFIPSLQEVTTLNHLKSKSGRLPDISISSNDPAFIQYTSGSTGNPKGVLLTHGNLLANIHAYGKGAKVQKNDVVVSWLPLYHDMGLIGTWLGSLFYGLPFIIMSPLTFLTHPERWLWAIHRYRGTVSAGPNFAYELCVKKIDEKNLEGLDLSSWRIALNGAEAVYPKTLETFTKKFTKYNFKPEAFFPAFGLAENAVALTFPPVGRGPRIDRIARDPYEREGKAIPFATDDKNSLEFVGCGFPLPEHEIRIVNDENQLLPEREVGNLQFRGPSAMQGYYRNPEATAAVYHNGWWATGDLGYIADGELFVTGRKKDIIIKAGRNIYPPEIEEIASQVPGIRRGCVAAFGAKDNVTGTEKLIIVAETTDKDPERRQNMTAQVIEQVSSQLGIPPDHVILVPPRTIPKTSSGKLRRSSTQELYLKGKLAKGVAPAWVQVSKLALIGFGKKLGRGFKKTGQILYTGYVWALVAITVLPLWLVVKLVSRPKAIRLTRAWAKLILKLIGIPVTVTGKENLRSESTIYVSNHTSYVDAIVLMSVLPPNVLFVGKKELFEAPIFRTFMEKLGYLSVNRMDFTQSIADARNIETALHQSKSILIFPEGTFAYASGLRTFKLGAFKLAVETETPITPIALQGIRSILRSGSRLLKPVKVKVHIGETIIPSNKEWSEVIRLRDAARLEIAKNCGEPVLDLIRAGVEGLNS